MLASILNCRNRTKAILFATVLTVMHSLAQANDHTEAAQMANALPNTSYTMTIVAQNVGSGFAQLQEGDGVSSTDERQSLGPLSLSIPLTPSPGISPYPAIVDPFLLQDLAGWSANVEELASSMRSPIYDSARDEINATLRTLDDMTEDAAFLFKVLKSLQHFVYDVQAPPADGSFLAEPVVFFAGGSATVVNTDLNGIAETYVYDVDRVEATGPSANDIIEQMGVPELLIWEISESDRARVSRLLDAREATLARMRVGEYPDVYSPASNAQGVVASVDSWVDVSFAAVYDSALRDVVRLLWEFGPVRAPDDFWAGSWGDPAPRIGDPEPTEINSHRKRWTLADTRYPRLSQKPRLPEFSGDVVRATRFSVRGLHLQPVVPVGQYAFITPDSFPETSDPKYELAISQGQATRVEFFRDDEDRLVRADAHTMIFGVWSSNGETGRMILEDSYAKKATVGSTGRVSDVTRVLYSMVDWVITEGGPICAAPNPRVRTQLDVDGNPVLVGQGQGIDCSPPNSALPTLAQLDEYEFKPFAGELAPLSLELRNETDADTNSIELTIELAGKSRDDAEGEVEITGSFADAEAEDGGTICKRRPFEKPDQERQSTWIFDCTVAALAPGEAKNLLFLATMPVHGDIHWTATGTRFGDTFTELAGVIQQAQVEPEPRTFIAEVTPAYEQLGFSSLGLYSTVYPVADGNSFDGHRQLLVIGRNLPKRRGEAEISSLDDDVTYSFGASAQTYSAAELRYDTPLQTGLQRFFEAKLPVADLLGVLEEADLEAIIIQANFKAGVGPGIKRLKIDGVQAEWSLEFADTVVSPFFARLHLGDKSKGEPVVVDQLFEVYGKDMVQGLVEVSTKGLPMSELPVVLSILGPDGAVLTQATFQAAKTLIDGKPYFSTIPIEVLSGPPTLASNGEKIVALVPPGTGAVLSLHVEPSYSAARLPAAKMAQGVATFVASPLRSGRTRWEFAMQQAAICHSGVSYDPAVEDISESFQAVGSIDNWMFLAGLLQKPRKDEVIINDPFGFGLVIRTVREGRMSQDIKLGHHAAMILLRDRYALLAAQQEKRYQGILESQKWRTRLLEQWRKTLEDPVTGRLTGGLLAVKVKNPERPDSEAKLGQIVRSLTMSLNNAEWTNDRAKALAVVKQVDAAIVAALGKLIAASKSVRAEMAEEDLCDLEELAEAVWGFEPVKAWAAPTLVRRFPKDPHWKPDMRARLWMDSVLDIARDARTQEEIADLDTNVLLGAGAVITLPIASAIGLPVGAASLAASTVETGLTLIVGAKDYYDSEQELARALGLSVAICHIPEGSMAVS